MTSAFERWLLRCMIGLGVLWVLTYAAYGQSWHVGPNLAQLRFASREASMPEAASFGTIPPPPPFGPTRVRITASLQSIAALRSVTRERAPEGTGLYMLDACNVSPNAITIDAGQIRQALVSKGVSVIPKTLAASTLKRSRTRGMSILAKTADLAIIAAPLVLGLAAGGTLPLKPSVAGLVAGAGTVLRIIGESGKPELAEIAAPISELGSYLGDVRRLALEAGECTDPLLTLGSYRAGQARTLVIETE